SDKLTIHRTKLSNADEFYEKHYDGLLTPPEISEPVLLHDEKEYPFKVTEDSDIEISGYAFISVQTGTEVTVHVPKGVEVNIRPTRFKGGLHDCRLLDLVVQLSIRCARQYIMPTSIH